MFFVHCIARFHTASLSPKLKMQYVAAAISAAHTSSQFNAAVEAFLRTPVTTPSALARSITVLFRNKSKADAVRLLEITPFTQTLFTTLFPSTQSLDWTHRLTLRTALATSIRDAVRVEDDDDYDDDEEKNGRIKALILASSDRSIREAEADAAAEAEADADEEEVEEAYAAVKSESESDSDSDSDYTESSDDSDEFSNTRVIERVMSPGPRYAARPVRTSSAPLQTHRQSSLVVPPIQVMSHNHPAPAPPPPPHHPLDTIDATTVDMFDQRHAVYMRHLWRMRADFIESDEFTRRPSEDATKLLAAIDHLLLQEGQISTVSNDQRENDKEEELQEEEEEQVKIQTSTGSVLLAFVAIVMSL